jgi:hypothetical protein
MNKKELIEFLKENMWVDVKFNSHDYGGTNRFEITLSINGIEICKDSCSIDPTDDKSSW